MSRLPVQSFGKSKQKKGTMSSRDTFHASLKYPFKKLQDLLLTLSPEVQANTFLTTKDAAKKVHLSPRRINQLIQEDRIAAIKVGMRKKLVYIPSLKEFLEKAQDEEIEEGSERTEY